MQYVDKCRVTGVASELEMSEQDQTSCTTYTLDHDLALYPGMAGLGSQGQAGCGATVATQTL